MSKLALTIQQRENRHLGALLFTTLAFDPQSGVLESAWNPEDETIEALMLSGRRLLVVIKEVS